MLLSKQKNHRNPSYLTWLRGQKCAVSGQKAECAHHIRLGTNGGTGLKPSDYFCLPLLNEFHTTGPEALHIIGEETFLKRFDLSPEQLFAQYLKNYLSEKHNILYGLENRPVETAIAQMIDLIEGKLPKLKKNKRNKKTSDGPKDPDLKSKASESDFYQKAKVIKREKDKELRKKLKQKKAIPPKISVKDSQAYEMAKELKRKRDKELREKLKKSAKKVSKQTQGPVSSEIYQMAKEFKKERDKALRAKLREKQKAYRQELKQKLKENSDR